MAEPHPPESPSATAKRQRRPSVRLGDIGNPSDALPHRSKPWNTSKPRSLLSDDNHIPLAVTRKPRGRLPRSSWIPIAIPLADSGEAKSSGGEDAGEDGFREGSESCGGVGLWLEQLGLGRYAPVFEVHEVDEEVLPWLTLEDLRDMGISAVGSRRKMYCAIQKLRRSFA